MKKRLNIYPYILILITIILIILNYQPDTILSGWDNLHPEFNIWMNLKRSFSSMWQEYQGLGLTGGMAYASDIPRQLLILILSPFVPIEMIRYVIVFLMLLIGPLGMYSLTKYLTKEKQQTNLIAFSSGLFYLLNLGTLQNFYAPYSAFNYLYGFLPWLILVFLKYLDKNTRKNFLILIIINFLAIPLAHTPVLFLVYGIVLAVISIVKLIQTPTKEYMKRIATIAATILILNSFWLVQTGYYFIQNETVTESKNTEMVSEDIKEMNARSGQIDDVIILRGFWFDNSDMLDDGSFGYMMPEWKSHINNPLIYGIGIFTFIIILIGVITSFRKQNHNNLLILPLFLIAIFMLLNNNPPTGWLYERLISSSDFWSEAIRFPFTKLITLGSLTYAYFFGLGIGAFSSLTKNDNKSWINSILAANTLFLLIAFMLPAFSGDLIYNRMKVEYPKEYSQTYKWFEKQDKEKRILMLPAHSYLGWEYYDFGYRGSGFIWYGIEQPIISRTFDVWSEHNEQIYYEVFHAIYSKDLTELENIIDKYEISYILLDENIVSPDGQDIRLYNKQTRDLLTKSKSIDLTQNFENIFIYETKNENTSGLKLLETDINIASIDGYSYEDNLFEKYGNYFTNSSNNNIVYPITNFTSPNYSFDKKEEELSLNIDLSDQSDHHALNLGDYFNKDDYYSISIYSEINNSKHILRFDHNSPSITVGEETKDFNYSWTLEVPKTAKYISIGEEYLLKIPQIDSYIGDAHFKGEEFKVDFLTEISSTVDYTRSLNSTDIEVCGKELEDNFRGKSYQESDNTITLSAKYVDICLHKPIIQFNYQTDYMLLSYQYGNNKHVLPYVCLLEEGSEKCINKTQSNKYFHTETLTEVIDFARINNKTHDYWIQIHNKSISNDIISDITYKDIQLVQLDIVSSRVLNTPGDQIQSLDLPSNKTYSDMEITFPSYNNLLNISEDLSLHRSRSQELNCALDPKTGEIETIRDDQTIQYSALNAVNCDYFNYPLLNGNATYILNITGEKLSGKGLRIYYSNYENSNPDLEATINKDGTFNWHTILPQLNHNRDGFSLNIETSSIHTKSVNIINEIKFTYRPSSWLSTIYLSNNLHEENKVREETIPKFDKIGTTIYTSTFETEENFILSLNQAYGSGWLAFDNNKPLTKIKVNNWANGWKLESGKHNIIVIYLPQVIQWITIFTGSITLLMTIIKIKKKGQKHEE